MPRRRARPARPMNAEEKKRLELYSFCDRCGTIRDVVDQVSARGTKVKRLICPGCGVEQ